MNVLSSKNDVFNVFLHCKISTIRIKYIKDTLYSDKHMCYRHLHKEYKISIHTTRSYTHAETAHEYKARTNTISSAQSGLPTMDGSVSSREGYGQVCLMNSLMRKVSITQNVSWQRQRSGAQHHTCCVNEFRWFDLQKLKIICIHA